MTLPRQEWVPDRRLLRSIVDGRRPDCSSIISNIRYWMVCSTSTSCVIGLLMRFFRNRGTSGEDESSQERPNLFEGLKRGNPDQGIERRSASSDHFARTGDVVEDPRLHYDGSGDRFFLGAIGSHLVGIRDDRHIMTVAGSRSGKSTAAIIPNLLQYRGSVLAIDPKGELASRTARRRAFGVPGVRHQHP